MKQINKTYITSETPSLLQGWDGSVIDEEDIKTVCMQYPD